MASPPIHQAKRRRQRIYASETSADVEWHFEPPRDAMRERNAALLVLDPAHCRAICDEIGERLRAIMTPGASDIPPRLLDLMARLAALEQRGLPHMESAPSIVPSREAMSLLAADVTAAEPAR